MAPQFTRGLSGPEIRPWRLFRVHLSKRGRFPCAHFEANADFTRTTFCGDVSFNGTQFLKRATFFDSKFERTARFNGAKFAGAANFGKASFAISHTTRFDQAHFFSTADFLETKFPGEVSFRQSRFQGPTSFWESHFQKNASFNAIQAESAFSLANARFDEIPDFIQAHFPEAPRLDNVQVPIIGEWQGLQGYANAEAAPCYRALKRLAIQGHDHDRELRFFADELRSLRGQPDQPFPNPRNLFSKRKPLWQGGGRYWFGILYEVFSDFGRSIARPLALLVLTTVLFAEAYHYRHFRLSSSGACLFGTGDSWLKALYLSIRKALIFPGLGPDQKLDQSYACLYGSTKLSADGSDRVIPVIPDSVAYLGIAQTLISAVLIFLFLLAVRNQFRIK